MEDAIGEVLESNTRMLKAEVPADITPPVFGAWIKVTPVTGPVIYGIVSLVEQGSVMPNRRTTALGKSTDELVREMPQVIALLRTSFTAVIVAYKDADGRMRQTLPPAPAPIHGFVAACTPEEISGLGMPFDYFRTLVHSDTGVPVDDLLVATLRQIYAVQEGEGYQLLVQAGRVLSRLFQDDHERLQAILRRVQ